MKRKVLYLFLALFLVSFSSQAQVSLIGPGASGSWSTDVDLTTTDNITWTATGLVMPGGEFKFRLGHDWTTNWGVVGWPSGTGTQNGPNITAIAGTYDVTFNQTTGAYTFSGGAPISTVILVGTADATVGGDTMTTTDGITYTLANVTLLAGTAQFTIDAAPFGGSTFPTGTITDPTLFIPVTAGVYTSVTVNIVTGDYSFVAAPVYPVISITGSAVGGWGTGFDFDMTTTDGVMYTYSGLVVNATAGSNELKFRTNHDWGQPNYGGSGWPSGVATTTGGNIPAAASGTYYVTFNLTTGEYTFSFPTIAVVGAGAGGWPSDPQVDAHQLTTTDGANYSLIGLVLTDGPIKLRQNNGWAVNWGGTAFPTGTGVFNGPDNIPATAGTYDVTFNLTTLVYNFQSELATTSFNTNSMFNVYPNPTSNNWNFTSANIAIEKITITDVLGKIVLDVTPRSTEVNLNASSLNTGIYFARISTTNSTKIVKLVKN